MGHIYGAVYEAIEHNERQTSPLIMLSRYLLGNTEPDEAVGRVALKETFDASSISSFAREFSVLSSLEHPNLPRYIDIFEAEGNGYLVMDAERVPGQSLQEMLDARTELLPESQVLGYALQLCDVLEYLHSQQPPILHRDIKPANIRLTPEGRIKERGKNNFLIWPTRAGAAARRRAVALVKKVNLLAYSRISRIKLNN